MNDSYLPDFIDDPSNVLPSFRSIRKRTHDTLYAFGVDKSPKGSVDAPIRDLVDLINKHPSFSTLSSCSGRIAIFDPVRAEATEFETTEHDDQTNYSDRIESGKGSGGWLFVSHEPVDAAEMEKIFQSNDTNHREGKPCTFRLEPMLLHIAAANLERGRQLMKLVLALGFRESGLMVTPSRVTVAVRSYSLALNVPMATSASSPWHLPDTYWRSLVEEANRRLTENANRIQELYEEIESTLFQPRQPIYVQPLPDLHLWGHSAVAFFGENKGREITDILVVGGYGSGPTVVSDKKETAPSRSEKVYRLRRHGLQWQKHWELLHSMDDTDIISEATRNAMGIITYQRTWGEREFAAACILPVEPTMLCVFGGRMSPTRPLDDLVICEYTYSSYAIAQQPTDIRGELPAARWGHTLTALSGDTTNLAVLVGGRNETSAFNSVHVLSTVKQGGTDDSYLLWETISSSPFTTPRFHHTSVSMGDQVFVFGGLSDVNNLLESFSSSQAHRLESFLYRAPGGKDGTTFQVIKGVSSDSFGLAACLLDVDTNRQDLVLCGGISHGVTQQSTTQMFELQVNADGVAVYYRPIKLLSDTTIDFGAMVHHQCLPVCSTGPILEIVSIGGGVQGFGFQQTYAKSHMLVIDLSEGTLDVDPLTPIIIKKRLDSKSLPSVPISPVHSVASEGSEPGLTDVLLVKKQDAKQLKTLLEASSFLHPTYRMSPVADSDLIAVPVTRDCLAALDKDEDLEWMGFVQGRDKQVLPYRTAAFARRG